MNEPRLRDYLDHMQQAAEEARSFVEGMSKEDFLADKRTQQAVIMSLIIAGEAAAKLIANYPEFVARHREIAWHGMRGMRNRIAHGYFDVNLDVVWDTVQIALGDLLRTLPAAVADAQAIPRDSGGT